MRIQLKLNLARLLLNLLIGRAALDQVGDRVEVARVDHVALWERELEERVVWYVRPVDELFAHVVVGAEGKHTSDDVNREALLVAQTVEARNVGWRSGAGTV